jgi:carboxypeptidase T
MQKRVIRAAGVLLLAVMGCNGGGTNDATSAATDPQPLAAAVDKPQVVRVYFSTIEELNALAGEKAPWEVHHDQGYAVVEVHGQAELDELRSIGYRVEIDPVLTAQIQAPPPDPNVLAGIPGFPCYRTVEETYASAAALAANHPTLATWTDIGNSWNKVTTGTGYDINVLKLTNQNIPGPKPTMFVMAAIHAREYATAELATRFAEHLVNGYGTDADATWLLDHHEFHLVLQSNPDGRKQAEGGVLWRKNTDGNYCGPASSSRGADLNRNYPYRWGGEGSSGAGCNETYRGPTPGSEPETQAIMAYVRSIFPDQRDESSGIYAPVPLTATGLFFDIHSYSELVLWPWGFGANTPPNNAALRTLGRKFAFFNDYMPQRSIELYAADGVTIDFAFGELGVASYTFEIGTSFFQSCSSFESQLYPDNLSALLYAAKVPRTPYITPAGPEALSVAFASASVVQGQPAALSAVLNDARFSGNNGVESVQAIAGADVYVGTPPWVTGAPAPVAMTARDGSFNATSETADATIATGALPVGRHLVYVQGRDALGNRGPVSAAFLDVLPGAPNQAPSLDITSPASGTTVPFGTPVNAAATATDPESGNLSAAVTWTSSIDGPLGSGAALALDLSVGTHTITAQVTDAGGLGASDAITVTVTPPPPAHLFEENFEDGTAGWAATGLWHLATSSTCASPASGATSPPNAMYYGQDATCNFNTGLANTGTLTSPVITGIAAGSVLRFSYFRRVESNSALHDVTSVEIVAGATSTTVFTRNSSAPSVSEWLSSGDISLAAFAGQSVQIRFRFHSRNNLNNNFTDWLIDDIVVD